MMVTRFTIDLFRAVPLSPLTIATEVLRDGRRIQVAAAGLYADGVEVARASALKVRLTEVDLAGVKTDVLAPGPEEVPVLDWRGMYGSGDVERFHTDGIEIRSIDNTFLAFETGRSWVRLRARLLDDEQPTPFQLVATLADVANGNAQMLDPRSWLYVNPDIALSLHRYPSGEWIGMRSTAYQHASGVGMTDTTVFDTGGRIGRITQSQVIEPR